MAYFCHSLFNLAALVTSRDPVQNTRIIIMRELTTQPVILGGLLTLLCAAVRSLLDLSGECIAT
jgi:hypothetical protein